MTSHDGLMADTSLLCGFIEISFHASRNCWTAYLYWQYFQVDTTWVPLKTASMSTLNAGDTPVAPLDGVLELVLAVGGGDYLPSGDP